MSIKLADILAPMADFPAAMAEHIEFNNGKNLQEVLDEGIIGGVELTQAEYDALTDEEKKNGLEYRCTDSGRIYINDVLYSRKKEVELETYEEYKALEEAGLVEADVDYVVHSNQSGVLSCFLISDLDTNHGDSEISTYEVIETLKSDVLTVKDEIANPIKTTLDITLAENDCNNIPSLMEDMTVVVSTVSADTVAHTPKDTFSTETGFFEITTTRQNSTYAWQTAKKLAEKSNVFQRCLLNGVWSDWTSIGSIRNEVTNDVNTWSSSKIASELSAKASVQSFNKPATYNTTSVPYLKISRYGGLAHVQYYACETYIICSHAGNVGILNFIRNDNGVRCVYHDTVGSSLKLAVEKYNEYDCWLKYSGTESELFTVYSLNGYKPSVTVVANTSA